MIDFFSSRPLQPLAEALFHFLWQGALLFALLKIVSPLLCSAQQRHAATLLALCLMLMAPFVTYYLASQRESADSSSLQQIGFATGIVAGAESDIAGSGTHSFSLVRQGPSLCVGLWLLGVLVFATRLLVGYAGIVWLRGERHALPAQLAQRVAWLGRRLGVATHCRVFLSPRVDEAVAVGCLKPLVLVPLAWAGELPMSVLEAVIAHELAHIRRWDLWTTLLQRLAETLLFYHPAVWWVSRQLTLERELCCDELAVAATQRRTEYALALEIVARRMSVPPPGMATSFLGGGNMNLLKRVQNVLTGPAREATSWWPAGLAVLAAPAIAALALSGWSPLPATADDDDVRDNQKAEQRKIEELEREVREGLENLVRQAELKQAVELERKAFEERLAANKRAAEQAGDDDSKQDSAKKPIKKDASKKDVKKVKGGDDFNFADFKPQTDREERLVAVIKKLQAQLKESGNKKGSSDPDYYESKRAVEEKAKQEGKQNYELEYQKQIEAAEKAALDKLETIRKKRESYKKEVDAKAAAVDKETAARKEKRMKEGYGKGPEMEAILRKAEKALAEAAKDSEDKAAMMKKMAAIKEKGIDKEAALQKEGGIKQKIPDDVESLRRALEEQEVRLRKTQEALERLEAGFKKETKKKAPPQDNDHPKQDPNKGERE